MYLENICIRNFRLFKNLDLKLNPGLNVLVGENDAGKTSLIDAIRYTLGTNSAERNYIDEADFFKESDKFLIQLKFVALDKHAHVFVEHLTHEEFTDASGNKRRKAVLYVQLAAHKTGQEKRGYPTIRTELRSGQDGNGLPIETEIKEFLSTTYLKPLRNAEQELASGRGSRLSQILNSSKELISPKSINEILGHIGEANSKLLEADRPIHSTSRKIKDDYLHKLIFEEDKALLSAIIDIAGIKTEKLPHLTDSQKRKHLRIVLEGLNLALTDDRRKHGLGYHNLLFMAAELLLLEQELDNEFPLLLIEEPEAHLHPQLQMKLLQFIISKAKSDNNESGIQCLISSHSPNISSKASPSDIIMLSKGKPFALRQSETELSGDDYNFLRKFLDVTKANIFFAKAIILVEGDSENILIPTIAKLIGKPLEDYGISVVKCDNSGSWKRFAKIFLRKGKDVESLEWNPVKIAVLRDLDLWPESAEAIDQNKYGHLVKVPLNANGRGGNLEYWENSKELNTQILQKKKKIKEDKDVSLERQNIKIMVSDRWTFEFCLARYGLFEECYIALNGDKTGIESITGNDDEKATYIQSKVSKTDFAYKMAEQLEKNLDNEIKIMLSQLTLEEQVNIEKQAKIRTQTQAALREKIPPYILEAIDYVTSAVPQTIGSKASVLDATAA